MGAGITFRSVNSDLLMKMLSFTWLPVDGVPPRTRQYGCVRTGGAEAAKGEGHHKLLQLRLSLSLSLSLHWAGVRTGAARLRGTLTPREVHQGEAGEHGVVRGTITPHR
jgi:hypothetical protein